MSATPIQLKAPGAEIFVPDGRPLNEALQRTTHLGIGAHPDDLEIMACEGIVVCFDRPDKGFTGVVVTNGAGGARADRYKSITEEQFVEVRREEQKKAAVIGKYKAQLFLNHTSSKVRGSHPDVASDLGAILSQCQPKVVYTHNFADKHDTHVAVASRVITALRQLPEAKRPPKVVGCEVWRDLDWLRDQDKLAMDVDGHGNLADSLMGVYGSQIAGGKRYDLAVKGRRLANATFFETNQPGKHTSLIWGMDLTPLVQNPSLDYFDYVKSYIDLFADEVKDRIKRMNGR